jgi:hypothetical protein
VAIVLLKLVFEPPPFPDQENCVIPAGIPQYTVILVAFFGPLFFTVNV